jgi:tetratricopeptide (TPR) repeat protein
MRFIGRLSCLILCFGLGLGGVIAQSTREIRQASALVQKGDRAFKSGNADKARRSFQKALEVVPDFPEAHLGLGHIAMTEARFEDALAEYTTAKEGYGGISDLMLDLQAERYADAQREIRVLEDQVRVINDTTVKVSESTRTTKTLQLQERIRALRAMEYPTAENAHKPPPELYFHLGNALFRLGRREEALANWETCVGEDASFPLVYNNLAVIYMQLGRLDDAWGSLLKAEELGVTVNPDLKNDVRNRASAAGVDIQPQ